MKMKFSSGRGLRVLLAVQMICFVTSLAEARIDLSILQQQGYGMVELKRPQPNTLTVEAKINGQSALPYRGYRLVGARHHARQRVRRLTQDADDRQYLPR